MISNVLAAAVFVLALAVLVHAGTIALIGRKILRPLMIQPAPLLMPQGEMLEFELSGCCRGPLPEAQDDSAGNVVQLVPGTPEVTPERAADTARRRAARDRVQPDSVTDQPQDH